MATMYNVACMMCGRVSGQIHNGAFHRVPGAPALEHKDGRTRCGFCGGNLYLEADDSLLARPTAELARERERSLTG